MNYFPFYTFVADCETTGIDPERHTLLSVGGVLLDGALEEVDAVEVFIKWPEYVVEPDALAVNNVDLLAHDLMADPPALALGALRIPFDRLGEKAVLAGWNVSFDHQWLWNFARLYSPLGWWPFVTRQGGGPFGTRMIDIYSLAVAVTGEIKPHSGVAHSALADARAEAEQYRQIVKKLRSSPAI
jgi:hypothetical protein